tara:strand:- start:1584 stop:1727 length:144 start_codon:yes stop_codon:yes gene_type:complete
MDVLMGGCGEMCRKWLLQRRERIAEKISPVSESRMGGEFWRSFFFFG